MVRRVQAVVTPDWQSRDSVVLTWDDLDAVQAALYEMASGWSAELNQTCLEESTIVVMPEAADDRLGPSFVLHLTDGRVHLDQFRWDEYRKLGAFRDLDGAIAAMRARLGPPATFH